MTRCPEFYEKFERDGNFCGLSAPAISQIKAYRELIEKIVKAGIEKNTAYEKFPERAAREVTSLKDDETRLKALNHVVSVLKKGNSVTSAELKAQIKGWLVGSCTVEKHADNPEHVSKNFTMVKSPTEQKPDPAPIQEAPVQPSLAAQMAGTVPAEPPVHRPPPCLGGGGCDQTPSKFITDKVRGNCCDAIGVPLNQLPGNECPYDVKLARKSESAFVPASSDLSVLAARPTETARPGYKITHHLSTPAEVSDHTQQFIDDLPEAARENVHALLKADKGVLFDGDPRELIIALLQEKAETIGGA